MCAGLLSVPFGIDKSESQVSAALSDIVERFHRGLRDAPVVVVPERPGTPHSRSRSSAYGSVVAGGWTKRRAASKITATARGRLQRKQWAKARGSSFLLTSAARGHLARKRVRDKRRRIRRALEVIARGVRHWRRKAGKLRTGAAPELQPHRTLDSSRPRRSRAAERTMRQEGVQRGRSPTECGNVCVQLPRRTHPPHIVP